MKRGMWAEGVYFLFGFEVPKTNQDKVTGDGGIGILRRIWKEGETGVWARILLTLFLKKMPPLAFLAQLKNRAEGAENGLEYTIVRPFNWIGLRMDFIPGIDCSVRVFQDDIVQQHGLHEYIFENGNCVLLDSNQDVHTAQRTPGDKNKRQVSLFLITLHEETAHKHLTATDCSSMTNQITIFQSDATELQAIAILWLARMEMEEKLNKSRTSVASPYMQFQLHPTTRGLSLKKSLQKFLQKRKDRIQATMPYSN
ncbi:Jasmonate ZIM-domain protein 11b [Abeliophyllum distichum]|uniref:Jasmonate ZIM-domain protein 11b n=1 Tax=Abeliophyllum distichum TaxID=126358 RepID=A0ABD1PBM9_9LAMI